MTYARPDAGPAARSPVDPRSISRVVLRPLATPLPLGILALAFGSLLLTSLQLHWLAAAEAPQVALVVLVLVVPLELLSAVIAFMIRDVTMATGLGVLTGAWAATATLMLTGSPGRPSSVLGLVAIGVGVALVVPASAAAPAKPAATVLFTVAAARFGLTAAYELGAGPHWSTAAGVTGLVMVGAALYSSLAFALEDARHHAVLPVSRRSTSAAAVSGDMSQQLETLATEAGVRQES